MGTFCYLAEIKASLGRINGKNGQPVPITIGMYVTFDGGRFRVKERGKEPNTWVLTRTVVGFRKGGVVEIVRTSDEIRQALGDPQIESSFNAQGLLRR